MKIYLIIFLLSFFGFTNALYERYVYDINYKKEYIVNNREFGGRIPYNIYLHFLLEIGKDTDIYIKVSNLKGENIGFQINFCKYSSKPSHEQIKEDHENHKCLPEIIASDERYEDGKYNRFLYNLSVGGEIKYISVNVRFYYYSITYFSVLVGPQEKKYKLYDISYKNEFKLNDEDLNDERNIFLFRMKYETEDDGIIQLKVNREAYPDKEMFVYFFGYEGEPDTIKELENSEIEWNDLLLEYKDTNGNYSTYGFLINKIENATYLAIRVLIDKNISYFSIYVGQKEKEDDKSGEKKNQIKNDNFSTKIPLSIPLIVLIIILYTITILLIFYFILRKCKKKEKISSNEIEQEISNFREY